MASYKRRSSLIRLLSVNIHGLILFSAEKALFTKAVVMGTVSISWSNFVALESVLNRFLWYKKLKSYTEALHSFLIISEL